MNSFASCNHLATFGPIWHRWATFGNIWQHLATFGNIWLHLATFGNNATAIVRRHVNLIQPSRVEMWTQFDAPIERRIGNMAINQSHSVAIPAGFYGLRT